MRVSNPGSDTSIYRRGTVSLVLLLLVCIDIPAIDQSAALGQCAIGERCSVERAFRGGADPLQQAGGSWHDWNSASNAIRVPTMKLRAPQGIAA